MEIQAQKIIGEFDEKPTFNEFKQKLINSNFTFPEQLIKRAYEHMQFKKENRNYSTIYDVIVTIVIIMIKYKQVGTVLVRAQSALTSTVPIIFIFFKLNNGYYYIIYSTIVTIVLLLETLVLRTLNKPYYIY